MTGIRRGVCSFDFLVSRPFAEKKANGRGTELIQKAAGESFPAKDAGDLLSKREGVEGFEKDGLHAEIGEAALVGSLDFGGEEQDGDQSGEGILAEFAEGGGSVHAWHHDIEEDGVRLMLDGTCESLRAGVGCDHSPAGN